MARLKIGNVFPPLAYLLKHCAPAGYGLGGDGRSISDFDSINFNGFFVALGNVLNAPPFGNDTYSYGWGFASSRYGEFVEVTYYPSLSVDVRCHRRKAGGVWSEWEFENPPMQAGVAYRTTEQYMEKPVYACLVNAGAYPETGLRNYNTGIEATGIVRFNAASGYYSLPLAGNMEINTFHENGKIVLQMKTSGERIFTSDVYATLYYTIN
jgi:hypothetical protein